MATDPNRPKTKWLWPLVIAALAILLIVVLLDPSGDRDGAVEDPIVTGEVTEPGTETGAGIIGEGLPGEGATDPAGAAAVPPAGDDGPAVETQPAEAVEVPPAAPLDQ